MQEFFVDDFVKSDSNTYYMADDSRIINYVFPQWEKDDFIKWSHKEETSSFILLSEIDRDLLNLACSSDDIDTIKKQFAAIS